MMSGEARDDSQVESSTLADSMAEDVLASADEALAKILAETQSQPPGVAAPATPADAIRWAGDRITELLSGLADLPLAQVLGWDESPETNTQTADRLTGAGQATPASASQTPAGEQLLLAGMPGETVECQIWIHQLPGWERTSEDRPWQGAERDPRLRFGLTELAASDCRLATKRARFDPDSVQIEVGQILVAPPAADGANWAESSLPLRTRLTLAIPADASPGNYQGQAIAYGIVDASVDLTVVVT